MTWAVSEQVAFVDDGKRVVVLNLAVDPPTPQLLAHAAGDIWRLVQQGSSTNSIINQLIGRYRGNPLTVALDVEHTLRLLEDLGLITSAASSGTSKGLPRP